MKQDRLFQILYILLSKKIVTAPELAKKLEVSVRTIYRDIDTLSYSGIPIYALSGKNGGISIMPEYKFDKSLLTDKEQNELIFALQSIKATEMKSQELITKLSSLFKKQDLDWIEVDFSRWGHRKLDHEKFDTIKNSILDKQVLSITYQSTYEASSVRYIKPIKLIFKQSNWYLQAFCMKKQDYRTFKINRITSLTLCDSYFDDVFETPPQIDQLDNKLLNLPEIKLKISKNMAYRVYDEFAPSNIRIDDDGNFIVSAYFPIDNWVYNYIMSFGVSVKILEPIWLVDELNKYINTIQNHFIT